MTMILSKGYKKIIYLNPVLRRQLLPKRDLRSLGSIGCNVSQTVANAVHMGINTYPWMAEAKRYNQICGLAPYPFKL